MAEGLVTSKHMAFDAYLPAQHGPRHRSCHCLPQQATVACGTVVQANHRHALGFLPVCNSTPA